MTKEQLIAALERICGPVHAESDGRELVTVCPECGKEDHLYISCEKACYHCFVCGASGTLRQLLHADIPVFVEGFAKPKAEPPEPAAYPPGEIEFLPAETGEQPVSRYLARRGFDPVILGRAWGLGRVVSGQALAGGTFDPKDCVYIPFYEDEKLIGYQLRKTSPGGTKYYTMAGFRRGNHLYNSDRAKASKHVVITEGVFDAIRVGTCAVATLGKIVTDRQIELLADWKTAILLLDPDAKEDQQRLVPKLKKNQHVVSVELRGFKDPAEANHDELWNQIHQAAAEQGVRLF